MAPLLASDYDKSKYLRAEDLKRDTKFRISPDRPATEEPFEENGKPVKKLVVWFTNDPRGLVLNKTNNRTLRGAFGDDTANWASKIIAIFPTVTEMRGKMTAALRVRIPPPKPAAVAPQQPQATTAPQQPAAPQQPVTSGNGAAAPAAAPVTAAAPLAVAALAALDPELEPDPVKPIREELDDENAW